MHDGASFNFALTSSLPTSDSPRERKLSSHPTCPICARTVQTPRANHSYSTMISDLSSSLKFPDTGFDIVDASEPIEEETLPNYSSANYYAAHIGQVLLDRYQIVGKLGYGVTSTVWQGRDLLCVSPSATLNLLIQLTGLGFL
ncbi:protein kinase [Histoplasma ohiense]|nr:protein kinase [Histoplasma ohiense (nom. inval.)]